MKMNEKEMIALFIGELDFAKVDVFIANNGLDSVDRDRRTLLFSAIVENQLDLVTYLLEKGCAVNIQDKEGFTPLHFAAMYDLYDIAELLLLHGADVHATDKWGNTPLHRAMRSQKEDTSLTELLLAHGAHSLS